MVMKTIHAIYVAYNSIISAFMIVISLDTDKSVKWHAHEMFMCFGGNKTRELEHITRLSTHRTPYQR